MNERKGVHKIMAYNTLTEREAFYCLCHVPGFGSATIGKLRERFGTYQEVWTAKGTGNPKKREFSQRSA